jgi:hypothetical protein
VQAAKAEDAKDQPAEVQASKAEDAKTELFQRRMRT